MQIILTQPNYAWLGKRSWLLPPYTLALLNACLNKEFDVQLFDPNYNNMTEEDVLNYFKEAMPDIVGVSSISTEYTEATKRMTAIIKEAVPNSIVILGGIIPTVITEAAMKDPNVDYWVIGEGEFRLPKLLRELGKTKSNLSSIDGLAYWKDGSAIISQPSGFISDLDSVPLPDYGNLNPLAYGSIASKYSLLPRKLPYATILSSRGCPYKCIFCAASTVTGRKVRLRSASNVLNEIDMLYKTGIREIFFLDDHFLASRKRAIEIMRGLIERKYGLAWKCANLTIFMTNREILELMKESGCYQLTFSIESGSQYVLDNIINKPVKLDKVPTLLDLAQSMDFETVSNFVIGFPGETWEQIRETFRYAEGLNVDLVNFHIATPLPKTELMKICLRDGYLPEGFDENTTLGYTKGIISTDDFKPVELEILRAFEWDRINFSTAKRKERIARMHGINVQELNQWRTETRRKCGINVFSS